MRLENITVVSVRVYGMIEAKIRTIAFSDAVSTDGLVVCISSAKEQLTGSPFHSAYEQEGMDSP